MAETSSQQPEGATASPPADDTNMDMDIDENEDNGAAEGGQGRILDLPTNEQVFSLGETVEIEVDQLNEMDHNMAASMLMEIDAKSKAWLLVAQEKIREGRVETAQKLLEAAVNTRFRQTQDYDGMCDAYTFLGHIHLMAARSAPKTILEHPKQDILPPNSRSAEEHKQLAADCFQRAEQALQGVSMQLRTKPRMALLVGKLMLALFNRAFAEAERSLNQALQHEPNNLIVLMCQGRLYLQSKRPDLALRAYQKVLQLAPDFEPDPRVGIGLGYWLSGDHRRAQMAWKRALKKNANNHGARLLLTIAEANEAKSTVSKLSEEDRQEKLIATTRQMGQLFVQTHQKLSPVALSLIRNTEVQGQLGKAIKLAERALQYADTAAHTRRAVSERTRLAYMAGDKDDVETYAGRLRQDPVPDIVVEIVRAQNAISSGNFREALNIAELAVRKIGSHAPVELNLVFALLLAYPHPGMPSSELASNTKHARDMLDSIHETYKRARNGKDGLAVLRSVANDPMVFVQLAKLWQTENFEKAVSAYQTAIEIHSRVRASEESTTETKRDLLGLKMSNNLATLYMLQGNTDGATQMYEQVVATLGEVNGEEEENFQSTLLYNLGRAYEDSNDIVRASEVYTTMLAKHPEYVNAKIRLSKLAITLGRHTEADQILKEINTSHGNDLEFRSYVSHYLHSQEKWVDLSKFATITRRNHPDDLHALCTLGTYHYHLARDSKAPEIERTKDYCRAAEAFAQALSLDPTCTVAAQGLAIAIAEDTLPLRKEGMANKPSDGAAKLRGLDVALSIFTRIKDSMLTSSVLVNMGHCHFAKGDEERAIESYGAASEMTKNQDWQILMYLCRAYYAFASKTSNYSAMGKALSYAQRAMQVKPQDKTGLYNIAMIQQKAAEIILGLEPDRRSIDEVQQVIGQAKSSNALFRLLADNSEKPAPYDTDLADQRAKYGESLLRRAPDQIEKQETYEKEQSTKHEIAKQRRAEEKARLDEIQRHRIEAEKARLAEEEAIRERQRQEARSWREEIKHQEEEEGIKKQERAEGRARSRKDKEPAGSGEEGERKPRRKSKKKVKRGSDDDMIDDDEERQAVQTEDEETEVQARSKTPKPKKKRAAAVDPDGEDAGEDRPNKKTKFKSVAVLSDTDEE
ncbi:hypothetical protein QFC22_002812 [Naganishia vaughanmartiniae]|uniref:Uncharacterized protein n=1 Tax=Naganishia vaughanmartiniae TaxID=1424756 RepID=A0ACC2XAC2_9TREE|nr:hypothetical protein QFC22_002812 [Naganishia vaughanmartiniae]